MTVTNEDEDDMQQSYQEFMLQSSGGKKKKKKNKQQQQQLQTHQKNSPRVTTPSTPPHSSSSHRGNNNSSSQKTKEQSHKNYNRILTAFQGILDRDWIEVDDNLGQVVESIAHLRYRIQLESKELAFMKKKKKKRKDDMENNHDRKKKLWEKYGYRSSSSSTVNYCNHSYSLLEEDIELALSQDLLQHEKMLRGVRKLLSALSQAQETLGRRLDELWVHHHHHANATNDAYYYCNYYENNNYYETNETSTAAAAVEQCNQIYIHLAQELYRKQCLAKTLLDYSGENSLLYNIHNNDDDDDESRGGNDSGVDETVDENEYNIIDDDDDGEDNNDNNSEISTTIMNTRRNPSSIARVCSSQWSRNSMHSSVKDIQLQVTLL